MHAAPVQEADLHVLAEPAADDRVGVDDRAAPWRWCGSTRMTRPTRPSLLITVMSGWMPELGAGVDGDGAGEGLRGPSATTRAGTRA